MFLSVNQEDIKKQTEKFKENFENEKRKQHTAHILVIGTSGSGKSSLINVFFFFIIFRYLILFIIREYLE
jgi:predicted GTPase